MSSNVNPAKVFIGGLSWETSDQKLRAYFENFGAVVEAFVSYDRATGRPRGFGFVVFESTEVADKVVASKHTIDRREVEAKKAVPKEETPAGQPQDPSAPNKTRKIFVGGLAPSVNDEALRQHFEQFGAVEDAVVMYDHENKRPRGFGFITFAEDGSVEKVFEHGAMQTIHEKPIEIKPAVPRDQMPALRTRMAAWQPRGPSPVGPPGPGLGRRSWQQYGWTPPPGYGQRSSGYPVIPGQRAVPGTAGMGGGGGPSSMRGPSPQQGGPLSPAAAAAAAAGFGGMGNPFGHPMGGGGGAGSSSRFGGSHGQLPGGSGRFPPMQQPGAGMYGPYGGLGGMGGFPGGPGGGGQDFSSMHALQQLGQGAGSGGGQDPGGPGSFVNGFAEMQSKLGALSQELNAAKAAAAGGYASLPPAALTGSYSGFGPTAGQQQFAAAAAAAAAAGQQGRGDPGGSGGGFGAGDPTVGGAFGSGDAGGGMPGTSPLGNAGEYSQFGTNPASWGS